MDTFTCAYSGCGRTFARKEHLRRHEKSHDPKNHFVCHICDRTFNRKDSLQRHVILHGDVFKPAPSGRSKRACLACRSGKTKCDGNEQCSTCVRRGIECKYREQDQDAPGEPDDSPPGRQRSSSTIDPEIRHSSVPTSTSSTLIDSTVPPPTTSGGSLVPNGVLVDWVSNIQIRQDPEINLDDNQSDPQTDAYLDAYYTSFHHRWPVVHRPSLEDEGSRTSPIFLSVKMVGAWLLGTAESRRLAIATHSVLMEHITPQLCNVTSHDRFQQSFTAGLCQTALLNIIFTIYYGNDQAISRASILRNLLVAALREVGFFQSETAWVDEKLGYFLPMRLVKLGQRQSLSTMLYKVDAYLNLVRNQPATIMPEELHYPLPGTFALWNADGLHVWEERQLIEPMYRSQKSVCSLINDSGMDSGVTIPMLIEDVQICLCSTQSDVWRVMEIGQCEISAVLRKDALRRRLDLLKEKLNRMANQAEQNVEFGQESFLPLRHYFGFEDHSQPGWQDIVVARVRCLLFDSFMLYNLLNLHLGVDIATLTQLAKDRQLSPLEEASEVHRIAREHRHNSMRLWAGTSVARWTLCHAVDILSAHRTVKQGSEWAKGIDSRFADPITHVALCVAALVVWAFANCDEIGCDMCCPASLAHVELTQWSKANTYQKDKEDWIESGIGGRAQVAGIQLCRCNTQFLMAQFQMCLPEKWGAADIIAPGLFTSAG